MQSLVIAALIIMVALAIIITSYKIEEFRVPIDVGYAVVVYFIFMQTSSSPTSRVVWGIHFEPSRLTDHPIHIWIKSVTAYSLHTLLISCALYLMARIYMIVANPIAKDVVRYAWNVIKEKRFAEALDAFRKHYESPSYNRSRNPYGTTPESFFEWSRKQTEQAWQNAGQYKSAERSPNTYAPVRSERETHLLSLDLKLGATTREIKKAYRAQARKYHPDILMAAGATDAQIQQGQNHMQEINLAYDWLKQNPA